VSKEEEEATREDNVGNIPITQIDSDINDESEQSSTPSAADTTVLTQLDPRETNPWLSDPMPGSKTQPLSVRDQESDEESVGYDDDEETRFPIIADDIGEPSTVRADPDPTGPLPQTFQVREDTPLSASQRSPLGKRRAADDLAEYYSERLKLAYREEDSESRRGRSYYDEDPRRKESLRRAAWQRREIRALRQELKTWIVPPPQPLDMNVEAVCKMYQEISLTLREAFPRLPKE